MATIAGDEVTETIMKEYLVDFQTAEIIKSQLEERTDISFIDVLGFEQKISYDEVMSCVNQTTEKLCAEISAKIKEVNGGVPSAVFLSGGGSRLKGLREGIINALEMNPGRVAIAGNNFKIHAFSDTIDINNPEYATPIGILVSSGLNLINDSFQITLNGRPAKLFRSGAFTARDLLMMNGYSYQDMIGRSGKNIVVSVNGERVVLKDFPMSRYKYEFEGNLYQGFGLIFGQVEDLSIPARIGQGFAQTLDFVRMVWMSLGDLVTGRVAVSELSGVIGVVDVVSEVGANSATAALGVQNVFYFMALIAVNLAVMNMLPIPALDGGRIFFVLLNGLIYAVARRRIPEKYEGYVHAGAFVVLLALMAVVALHDVWNIFA
jgi:membrane-associated protease RseP (regulator of RpoE activity)